MSDPAKYRTREEVQKMREERDAIENIRSILLTGKHASEDDLKSIDKEIKKIVNESAEFAKAKYNHDNEKLPKYYSQMTQTSFDCNYRQRDSEPPATA